LYRERKGYKRVNNGACKDVECGNISLENEPANNSITTVPVSDFK
jgi:hypothetical protein